MDYFIPISLATFLDVDHVNTLLSMGGSESSQNASKILNCVPKMNGGLTGLE